MRLSLAIVTKDSARYIERLLRAGGAFADEIIVAVDASTSDRTEEICATYADRLFRIEPPGPGGERALAWLNDQCTGDWILRLDDDELPSAGLVAALPRLMRDRDATHYWLRRRWIVGRNEAGWLAGMPWWPDWQLRLFRNIPSLVRVPGRLHTSYIVQGDARYIYEGAIYHYDLVYHSLAERQQKVLRYDQLAPGNRDAFLYLVADDPPQEPAPDPIARIPEDDAPFEPLPRSQDRVPDQKPGNAQPVLVPIGEVGRAHLWRTDLGPYQDDHRIFQAGLQPLNCPMRMTAGEPYWVDVRVSNDSPVIWPSPGIGVPDVIVTYHWLHPSGRAYDFHGLQTRLPHTLRPGEAANLPALVHPPTEPGSYVLQWDLLIEQVAWFSTRGWQGPQSSVQVLEDASSTMQRAARSLDPRQTARGQPSVEGEQSSLEAETNAGQRPFRIAMVGAFVPSAGSVAALAGYLGAARRAGYDLRASSFGYIAEAVREQIPVAETDWQPDLMILLFESTPYLSPEAVAHIERVVPRSRRLVVDCDGAYSPPTRSGSDSNHPDTGSRIYWAELFARLSDVVLQPCLGPLPTGVKRFLFYGVDQRKAQNVGTRFEKVFDLAYVGNNWFRWHDMSWLCKGLAPVRSELGRTAVFGGWWDGTLPDVDVQPNFEIEKFLYSDPEFLRQHGVEIYPAVPFAEVEQTMGTARLHPVLVRPVLNKLGLVTPRMFETFLADTVPVLPPYFKHAMALYGGEVAPLYIGYRPADAILDMVGHYPDYAALSGEIAAKLAREHSYDVRLAELLGFVK